MKRQILFIAPFPPPIHGSAVVSQQIRDSQRIRETYECDFINLSTSRSVTEIGSFRWKKVWRWIAAMGSTVWKLATKRYDLCYLALTCHGRGFLKDSPFALICNLFRRPIVIHQHNKGMSEDVHRWPYHFMLPWVYKKAKVILLSERLYPDIASVVSHDQVLICPNGIPRQDYFPVKHSHSTPKLLFLSNMLESKGVLVLLDALRELHDQGQAFICDFVGEETAEIDADRFAHEIRQRQLTGSVFFHGSKSGAEKESYFAEADIFLFPSYQETFGLVNLEAMAHSLPIVATDEGGIPDIVIDGETGIICPRKDTHSLAHAIQQLIMNPALRQEMGKKGRERFESFYTLECFEERMLDCLNQSMR